MTPFQELDNLLAQSYSSDYWSDEGIVQAMALVSRLGETDWQQLHSSWRSRPQSWQLYCADVLSEAPPAQAGPILIAMLEEGDDKVALQAADALRNLNPGGQLPEVPARVIGRIQALAQRNPGLHARSLTLLLDRLRRKEG